MPLRDPVLEETNVTTTGPGGGHVSWDASLLRFERYHYYDSATGCVNPTSGLVADPVA